MTKKNGVNHSLQLSVVSRRKNVIVRLEAQLKSGVKNVKQSVEKLTESDIKRINSEIAILKSRI